MESDSTKREEYALVPSNKRERKPRRTKEEIELLRKRLLRYMFPFEEGKWSEEEIRQQEQSFILHNREETVEQEVPKVHNRKKIRKQTKKEKIKNILADLGCLHLKLVREDDYVICTKCGAKFKSKVKDNKGTSK